MHSGCIVIVTQAARRVLVGVAQLLGPDLEDARRRGQAVAARRRARSRASRPAPSRPAPRRARPRRPQRVPSAIECRSPRRTRYRSVVVGHQRASRRRTRPPRPARASAARATSTARGSPVGGAPVTRPDRLDRPAEDLALLVAAELGEVLVEPAVAGELVAAGDDRRRCRPGTSSSVWPGHEPRRRDAARLAAARGSAARRRGRRTRRG